MYCNVKMVAAMVITMAVRGQCVRSVGTQDGMIHLHLSRKKVAKVSDGPSISWLCTQTNRNTNLLLAQTWKMMLGYDKRQWRTSKRKSALLRHQKLTEKSWNNGPS